MPELSASCNKRQNDHNINILNSTHIFIFKGVVNDLLYTDMKSYELLKIASQAKNPSIKFGNNGISFHLEKYESIIGYSPSI